MKNKMTNGFLKTSRIKKCGQWLVFALFLVTCSVHAATYYSQGSLNANLVASWNTVRAGGGSAPGNFTAGDIFVIQNGHSMTTSAAWTVSGTGSRIQIESGGTLTSTFFVTVPNFQVDNGGTYIHNVAGSGTGGATTDFPGTTRSLGASSTVVIQQWGGTGSTIALIPAIAYGNLTFSPTTTWGGGMAMNGTLTSIQGNLTITATGGTTRDFRLSTSTGYTLNIGGNLTVSGGVLNLMNGSGTAIVNVAGNVTVNGGTLQMGGASGSISTLNVNGTASGSNGTLSLSSGLITASSTATHTMNIAGDMLISGGSYNMVTSGGVGPFCTINVNGTVAGTTGKIAMSGTGVLTQGSTSGVTITTKGNIELTGTSTFQLVTGTASSSLAGASGRAQVLNIGGNLNIGSGTTFNASSTSSSTSQLNFTGVSNPSVTFTNAGTCVIAQNSVTVASGKTLTLNNDLTTNIASSGNMTVNGTLNCSTNNILGTNNFILSSGATLRIGSTAGITSSGATGSIRTSGAIRTFNAGATYVYSGTTSQVTGSGLPASITGASSGLTINNSSGVSLSQATSVASNLSLTSGKLDLGANNLTLTGATVSGASSSNYVVTSGAGRILRSIASGGGSFVFPIGRNSSTYNPVTITNTGASTSIYTVGAAASTYTTAANGTNAQWSIASGTSTTSTFAFSWETADAGATLAASPGSGNVYSYNGSTWGTTGGTTSTGTPNVTTQSGVTSSDTVWTVAMPAAATAPTVTTTAASSVTSTGASTGGNVTSDGGATITERGVVYSTSSSPTTDNTKVTASGTTGSFTSSLSSLTPGTTYYIRAYAINSVGTSYGSEISFTTLALPTVTTASATSITSTSASSGGNVTSDGGATITERGIVYNTSTNPTTANTKVTASGTTGSFTSSITSLNPGVTYYVRAYAINSVGTSYGNEITFTTSTDAPTVTTTAISSIAMTSASTGGNVTSDGGAAITERGVVYSTSSTPTTSNSKITDAGTTGAFTVSLSSLTAGTTYYVRAYAINSVGTSYGSEQSFTTLNIPSVTTTAASLVTSSSASSGGNVTSDGGSSITERGIVYATSSNPTTADTKITDGAATTGSFTSALTGLSATTTYYIRAYAINAQGTAYGSEESFTTTSGAIAPTVSTAAVSNLGSTTVTVGGSVDSDGGDAITERGIVYSSSSNPTTADTKIADGSATTGSFSTGLTGLTPGATYHVRAYAINSIGTSYGSDVSFTMNAILATVSTTAVTGVTASAATTGGNVTADGGGAVTERGVVYSTSANPTTADTKVVDGSTGTGSFTSNLSGLSSVTTYYVRAYAINSAGTAYGSQESFTTLANAPTVTTTSISAISGSAATSGGNVTSDGGDAITERGIVYSTSSNPTTADTKVINGSASTGSFTSSLTGLTALTTYYVRAYATNNIGTSYGSEVSFTTISAIPTIQASNVSFSNITLSGMTINFTAGDGANSIVVVKATSAVNSNPVNSTTYNANTTFGSGTQIGTGNFVVYAGTGNSVSITGLTAGTTYHVSVYAYNGSGGTENYLTTSPATGNQATANNNYRSVASGNWNATSTWEVYDGSSWVAATVTPTSADGTITIQNGHTVTVSASITVDEVTVNIGGQITVAAAQTLTIANGNGSDLTVNGYLKNQGTVTNNGQMSVTGTYEHNLNGGTVPNATWNTNSTCLVTGVTSSTTTSGFSQDFYNFTWNCPGQTANLNLGMYNTTIRGDFNFLNGGAGAQETGLSSAGAGVGPNNVITIQGNFNVNSSVNTNQICAHRSGSASTVTNMTLNIQGNLNIMNGSFFLARNTGIATLNWNLYGNLNMTGGIFNSSHTAALFHFAKTGTQSFTKTAGTLTAANIVVDGVSTVDAGTSAFDGTCNLTISAGSTLISANASGSITTTGTKTLNAAANYVFNGTSAQTLPAAITQANNMTINNAANVTLGAATAVTGTLTLTSGDVILGANNLTLTNAISGANSTNYIVTNGAGLLKYLSIGNTARLFPVGNSTTSYTPLTITNTGTTNDISVGSSATITNAVTLPSKVVTLQWIVTPGGAGAIVNTSFSWNAGNNGASFSNSSASDLGVYLGSGPYALYDLGTLSGNTASYSGLSLANSANLLVIGNKNAIYAQQIVGFDVSTLAGGSGLFGASPYTATTLNANLTSSGLVRGSGLTTSGTAAASAWGAGGGFNSTTSALGISGNKFFTFTVKPNNGYSTELLTLNPISYRTSSSGPNAILIQYQINSGPFVDIVSTSLTTNTTAGQLGAIDLSGIAALSNVQSNQTVTFRFVPFGASGATGTFYINNVNASTASDFALNGNVNSCTTNSDVPVITSPICAGATSINGTSTEATGTVLDLYVNNTWNQSVLISSGTWSAIVPSLAAESTITAYATASGKCLSAVSSTITVTGVSAPTASAQSFCSATSPTVASLVATGTAVQWYDASTSGNLLSSETSLSSGTYYASQTVTGCESTTRTAATVTVNPNGTWLGGNGSWNNAANWCGGIPATSDNVVISSGNPILDINHTVASGSSLTLSGTATLTLNPNTILTIAGTANFGGQPVTLKSDASGTAAIGQVTGSLTGATNVTVERYIPSKRAWRALTAPLKGSVNNSIFYNWQNNGTTASGVGVELWGPSGTGMATGPAYNIRQYTTSGWADVTNTQSANLFSSTANNAYMVFVTGGFGSNNIGNGQSATTTLKATGELITGTVSFPVNSVRHSLIGNPFASPLSPAAIMAGNTQDNLFTNIWMWDPALSTNGAYVNYDASINSGTFSDISGSYTTSSAAIQSGQAFFVRAQTGTDTLTLNESMKSSTISNTFRNSNSIAASVFRIGFAKQIGTNWMPLDGAIAAFYDSANPAVDPADGTKMVNSAENMALVRGTTNLSIEHYPLVNATDQLNVKIWNTQQARYKLKLNTEEFTMVGVEAYLQDLYTGTTQPLNLDGSMQEYEFDVDPTVSASSGNRFRIVFTNIGLAVTDPEQGQMSIYPNPATGGKVTVSLPTGTFEGCSYELINVLGQVVRQDQIANGNSSQVLIPLTGLPTAWYALRIRKDNKVVYQGKLIINN